MKFSILALLAATGYVALLIVSFQQPLSLWRYAVMAGWLAIMAYVVMLAVTPMNRVQAIFGRVAIGCAGTYLVATVLFWPTREYLPITSFLPHEVLVNYWNEQVSNTAGATVMSSPVYDTIEAPPPGPGIPPSPTDIPSPGDDPWGANAGTAPAAYASYSYAIPASVTTSEAIAAMNFAVLFGFVCGGLAVMRCRRIERAQANEKRLATINPPQSAEVSAEGNY